MKFRVDRDAFAEAVAWTARALPARPAVPVLAGMRLEIPDPGSGRLRLSSFDYEVSARAAVDVDVDQPGAILVSGRLLAEIARNLPPHPVEVASDASRVLVTCGSARFTLLTLPLEDYPRLPDMPKVTGSIGGDAFGTAVRQVAPAASRDDTLPMLTGIHVAFSGDSLTLAATDRYRIAVRDLWWRPAQADLTASALVPARTLAETARALVPGSNVDIALSTIGSGGASRGEGMIGFETGGRRTTTRLIDSEFIKYESRFPTEFDARAEISTAPLTEAVKRVALVADRNTPLRLSFTQGEVVLEAGSGDDAQALEALETKYEGDDMRVAFSPSYLLDGIGGVESETAYLNFTAPTKPVVISGVPSEEGGRPDFRYLVMPLRVS
ncbi:DNA polymerase III subunit beta [Marinitenerispora sediminis]|uniref:Beta sliding clamp n=1 Tax=Marinitenerispora sediminis TaxID=1931232 RepID=A0A368T0T4_9ACTN|nr:DNA polymerase III subunit beta [Marinitenerispora sediminis]RCV50962.1 DNA polymerase III subunit beta [Marinitenerispora sediminis]RCV53133.1 DNA polymerase III subunit beta [Marinitenerispora sediminis]RCV60425.1 DNA polymerase III subunit beta [Marinitenerispora sediminis]